MKTTILRKLGGSTVVAIPPSMLDLLNCKQGDQVSLNFSEGKIEIIAIKKTKLTLHDRLKLYKQALPLRNEDDKKESQEWLDAQTVGKEVI